MSVALGALFTLAALGLVLAPWLSRQVEPSTSDLTMVTRALAELDQARREGRLNQEEYAARWDELVRRGGEGGR